MKTVQEILNLLLDLVLVGVTEGYEDESGFHFGVQSDARDQQQPMLVTAC